MCVVGRCGIRDALLAAETGAAHEVGDRLQSVRTPLVIVTQNVEVRRSRRPSLHFVAECEPVDLESVHDLAVDCRSGRTIHCL